MNRNEFEIFYFNYLKCYLNAHKTNQYIDSLFETREQKREENIFVQYPTRTTIIMIFILFYFLYQFNLIKSIRFSHRLRETER